MARGNTVWDCDMDSNGFVSQSDPKASILVATVGGSPCHSRHASRSPDPGFTQHDDPCYSNLCICNLLFSLIWNLGFGCRITSIACWMLSSLLCHVLFLCPFTLPFFLCFSGYVLQCSFFLLLDCCYVSYGYYGYCIVKLSD